MKDSVDRQINLTAIEKILGNYLVWNIIVNVDIFYIRNGYINKKEAMIKMKVDDKTRELQLQMFTEEYEAEYIFKV